MIRRPMLMAAAIAATILPPPVQAGAGTFVHAGTSFSLPLPDGRCAFDTGRQPHLNVLLLLQELEAATMDVGAAFMDCGALAELERLTSQTFTGIGVAGFMASYGQVAAYLAPLDRRQFITVYAERMSQAEDQRKALMDQARRGGTTAGLQEPQVIAVLTDPLAAYIVTRQAPAVPEAGQLSTITVTANVPIPDRRVFTVKLSRPAASHERLLGEVQQVVDGFMEANFPTIPRR